MAAYWATAHDFFTALEAEDETRHRYTYDSNNAYDAYDATYHPTTQWPTFDCEDNWLHSMGQFSRSREVMGLMLGYLYQCHVTGDSSSQPTFPGRRFGGGAGGVLIDAFNYVLISLMMWDPEGTTMPTLTGTGSGGCSDTSSKASSNDLTDPINNIYALWDLIDASAAGADSYSDYANLTIADLADALEVWQAEPCVQGQNQSPCEFYETLAAPLIYCADNEDCADGDVCTGAYCRTGDPHGNNLRDWIHHLASVALLPETTLWQTLQSSPCVGLGRNTAPFNGGYRTD